MKKKIVSLSAIAIVAVAAAFGVSKNANEVGLSDLALANVEALAGDESADDIIDNCYWCEGQYCDYVVVTPNGNTAWSHYNLENKSY